MIYLGIDVAKLKIDCCLRVDDRYLHRVFLNNNDGFAKLTQ